MPESTQNDISQGQQTDTGAQVTEPRDAGVRDQASFGEQARQALQSAEGGVAQPDASAQQPQASGVVDLLRQRGVDPTRYGIKDDGEALETYAQLLANWEQIHQAAQVGHAVMPHLDRIREFLNSDRQEPAPPPQPESKEPEYWPQPPEWSDEWAKYLTVDENGNVRASSPFYEPYAQAYERRQKWVQESARRLLSDPVGLVIEAPQFRERVQKAIDEVLEQRNSRQAIADIVRENAHAFFEVGPSGAPQLDPLTGEPVLSPVGRFARTFLDWAVQGDVKNLLPVAVMLGQFLAGRAQSNPAVQGQPSAPPPAASEASSPRTLAAPAASPRSTSRHRPEPPSAAGGVSFRNMLFEKARSAGVQV